MPFAKAVQNGVCYVKEEADGIQKDGQYRHTDEKHEDLQRIDRRVCQKLRKYRPWRNKTEDEHQNRSAKNDERIRIQRVFFNF